MPKASKRTSNSKALRPTVPERYAPRDSRGRLKPGNTLGFAAASTLDAARARRALNLLTLTTMHRVFVERGNGLAAARKVLKNQPGVFLKLMALLVPRELEITQTGGVRGMTDEQIERGIEALEGLLARRAPVIPGDGAKVIEASAEDASATKD